MGIAITERRGGEADGYLDAVAKLVPGEALIGYLAALQLPVFATRGVAHLALLVAFAAATPFALWLSARRERTAVHWLQYVVRTGCFVLVAACVDERLRVLLNGLRWLPAIAAPVVVLLTAVILAPAASAPPHH
jgi:hypothetical protein